MNDNEEIVYTEKELEVIRQMQIARIMESVEETNEFIEKELREIQPAVDYITENVIMNKKKITNIKVLLEDDEYITEATYIGGIQNLKEGKTKRALRIEVDNTESIHKDEPHCHAVIYDDGVPVDKIKNHPNTSRIQIRLDIAKYLSNRQLTLEQRNKFVEEMKRLVTVEVAGQSIQTSVWDKCKITWNMSDTVQRVTNKTMPLYDTLPIL